jgi:hypothetical protein
MFAALPLASTVATLEPAALDATIYLKVTRRIGRGRYGTEGNGRET